jgi:predicted ester cyclase
MPIAYSPDRSQRQRNVILVRRFIDEVWNSANPEAVLAFVDDTYVDHVYQPADAQGHMAMVKMFNEAFANARHHIEEITADAERVVARIRIEATHVRSFRGIASTGASITVLQYRSFRIANERIAEHHALLDTAALLMQIGGSLDAAQACKPR